MLQYILECIAFQLVFLIIYDLFLKRETFFQWNRLYLIGTYAISMVLPWIKIEAMKSAVPEAFQAYPEFLWNSNDTAVTAMVAEETTFNVSWEYALLFGGMFLATLFFAYKLYQIYTLKRKGEVHYFHDFTRVIVSNSSLAFSFFKSIFLGDKVVAKEHQSIVQHELVHIRQRHSYDLVFFELMRIVGWFNPLVYVYQSRVSELHEFIADAQVAKTHKKEQYQLLLSEVFQTQHISFINQFFKTSLIKKRIVMLQKTKSKKIWQLKYLLLVPMVLGMLAYTSSETQINDVVQHEQTAADMKLIAEVEAEIEQEVIEMGSIKKVVLNFIKINNSRSDSHIMGKREYFKQKTLFKIRLENIKPVEFGDDVEPRKPIPNIPLPSTSRYEDYVQFTKAFQILDENLKFSMTKSANNERLSIRMFNGNESSPAGYYSLQVGSVKDLTGAEVYDFNRKILDIFITKDSDYKGLILTDGQYDFEIFEAKGFNIFEQQQINQETEVIRVGDVQNDAQLKSLQESITQETENVAFAIVDKVPIFPGCEDEDNRRECFKKMIQKHISKNFNYPKEAQEKGIQGRVSIMLTISQDGTIQNVRMRGPDKLLEKEAARIISLIPKMMPAKHKGKVVNVLYSIPITFKLSGDADVAKQKDYENSSDVPFAVIEEVPVFPGCEEEDNRRQCFNKMMQKHISKNFNYPKEAQEKGIQGRVSIMFTISQDGSIQKVRMRGPDELLEKECARIISLLPRMIPGKQKGKAVDVPFSIPISFKLDSESEIGPKVPSGIEIRENGIKIKSNGGKNDPVFFIDGQESIKGKMTDLNPDDIESMNVLKGDAAIKKYGDKGKNGVIEITTKKLEMEEPRSNKTNLNDPDSNPLVFINGKVSTKKEFDSMMDSKNVEHLSSFKKEYAIKKYGKRGENGVIEILTKEFFNSNPKLEKVHSQMKLLRKERSRLLENSTEDNQIIRDLDTQIDALQKEEDKLVKEQLK